MTAAGFYPGIAAFPWQIKRVPGKFQKWFYGNESGAPVFAIHFIRTDNVAGGRDCYEPNFLRKLLYV
jgi:hypothetical protein